MPDILSARYPFVKRNFFFQERSQSHSTVPTKSKSQRSREISMEPTKSNPFGLNPNAKEFVPRLLRTEFPSQRCVADIEVSSGSDNSTITRISSNWSKSVSNTESSLTNESLQVIQAESDYGNLPSTVMVKILNYLSFSEAIKVGRVCRRWYGYSRSLLRKDVKLRIKNASEVPSLLKLLPVTLRSLSVLCPHESSQVFFMIEELFSGLKRRCPDLQTLSIDHGNFFYDKTSFIALMGYVDITYITLENVGIGRTVLESQGHFEREKFFIEMQYPEYHGKEYNNKMRPNVPLMQCSMTTLRFTNALLEPRFFSRVLHSDSNIKVLDLSYCKTLTTAFVDFLPDLPKLEELYIAGTPLTDLAMANFLHKTKNLKKLDLEDWDLGHYTLSTIRETLKNLTDLYLGCTSILCNRATEQLLFYLDGEDVGNLKAVCLENSNMRSHDYEDLKDAYYFEVVRGRPRFDYVFKHEKISCCNHFKKNHS